MSIICVTYLLYPHLLTRWAVHHTWHSIIITVYSCCTRVGTIVIKYHAWNDRSNVESSVFRNIDKKTPNLNNIYSLMFRFCFCCCPAFARSFAKTPSPRRRQLLRQPSPSSHRKDPPAEADTEPSTKRNYRFHNSVLRNKLRNKNRGKKISLNHTMFVVPKNVPPSCTPAIIK